MQKVKKISGAILFFSATMLLFLLSVSTDAGRERQITEITLEGNEHLAKEDYLKFAGFDKPNNFENLDLSVIKKRFEKHPYVKKADVKFLSGNKVYVILQEKKFLSLMNCGGKEYLLSSEQEVIPILQRLKEINYPFVENPDIENRNRFINVKKNKDLTTAYELLETAELLDHNFYKDISEINLRNGKDILIYFSSLDFPVIIGRNNEVKKLIYFNKVWEKIRDKELNKIIDYVDLRFNERMYLKIAEGSLEKKEQRT